MTTGGSSRCRWSWVPCRFVRTTAQPAAGGRQAAAHDPEVPPMPDPLVDAAEVMSFGWPIFLALLSVLVVLSVISDLRG